MKQKTLEALKKFVYEVESFADSVSNESPSLRWEARNVAKATMELTNTLNDETADEEKKMCLLQDYLMDGKMIKLLHKYNNRVLYVDERVWGMQEQCPVTLAYHTFWAREFPDRKDGFVVSRDEVTVLDDNLF